MYLNVTFSFILSDSIFFAKSTNSGFDVSLFILVNFSQNSDCTSRTILLAVILGLSTLYTSLSSPSRLQITT